MALKLITAPIIEPVTLAEAKLHLRVDHTDEDSLITNLIKVARELVEDATWRGLLTQTWELRLDNWPSMPLKMPKAPLQSIVSIKYMNDSGVESTVANSVYDADTYSEPGRIFFKKGQNWPSVTLYERGGVRIQFKAGWLTAAEVSYKIKAAMLLLIGHLYENREEVIISSGLTPVVLPAGVNALLASEKVWKETY
jgi:uncharacterized phiE125 gp8 family phage protein